MSFWAIIAPESGENMFLNPSAETIGNYAAHNGATVARSNTYTRFGATSYSVTLGAANRGINLTAKALSAVDTYVTFYVFTTGTISGTLQASLNSGSNYTAASVIGGKTGGWVRYGALVIAAQVTASGTAGIIRDTADDTLIYIDGAMAQQVGYATTYIDGDQPGCVWSNLYHGSSSTRDAQYRGAGRERDLYDDYAIGTLRDSSGIGLPPIANNLHSFALKSGAEFRSTKVLPRELTLVPYVTGSTWVGLHEKRQNLFNLISPEEKRGEQECVIVYKGAGASESSDKLYGRFRYNGGGEFANVRGFNEQPIIRLTAVDPYWYEDNQSAASLDFQDSLSNANYLAARVGGAWQSLGTGGAGAAVGAYKVIVDQDGKVYYLGTFTGLNSVANTSGSGYWNGTTFVTLGTAPAGGSVLGGVLLPNKYVVAFGSFTSIGGVASTAKIAAHNGTAWVAYGNATGGDVSAAVVDPTTGRLYVGGSYTNIGGSAINYIAYTTNGTSYTAAGSPGGTIQSLAWGPDGYLYAGVNTVNDLMRWDGSTWTMLASYSAAPEHLAFSPSGRLYYAVNNGVTSKLYEFNGTSATELVSISNVSYDISAVRPLLDGTILVGLNNGPTINGVTFGNNYGIWNGSRLVPADIDVSVATQFLSFAEGQNGNLFTGWAAATTGTATVSGRTTVTNNGTAKAAPAFTLIGPSSGSCTLKWLENQSTGHRLYFNMTVQSGEVVTIDTEFGLVESNFRGAIGNQPLDSSNFTNFRLLPGANTIAAYITGTTTAAVLLCTWAPRHMSVDGAA